MKSQGDGAVGYDGSGSGKVVGGEVTVPGSGDGGMPPVPGGGPV